jgi:hypothetical protein
MRIRDLGSGMETVRTRDPGWKKADLGSGINIPDQQHWYQLHQKESLRGYKVILMVPAVFRNHQIHMFFGLPDPLVRGMDLDPDPSISASKNGKKNLDSYCFVTSFGLLIFEK